MKESTRRKLRYTGARYTAAQKRPPPGDWAERQERWDALLAAKNLLITELYAEIEHLRAAKRNQGKP